MDIQITIKVGKSKCSETGERSFDTQSHRDILISSSGVFAFDGARKEASYLVDKSLREIERDVVK